MNMVNTRTKPIPIKANSSSVKKSSSTSSPQSSSSSASPQTSSSSSNESPATTIQTLVRSNSSRASFSTTQHIASTCHTARSTKSTNDVPSSSAATTKGGNVSAVQSLSPQSTFSYGNNEQPSKLETAGAANSLPSQGTVAANNNNQHHCHISSDILDDLASRFIINVPDDERNNLIRICFQIELAHWFYLDFFCINDEKKCGMKQFAMSLFHHIPFLRVHLATIDKILENWKQYKLTVPTYGAILLSEDLNFVLLVQSYWAKSSWGFPKGKVNENEDPIHCAAREVYEETGYDITHLIIRSDYIESVINDQYTRLYLVRNVPLKTQFMPRTRKEIKCCEWFPIDSLPTSKNDAHAKQNLGINANSFFMIMPFIKRLKKWVCDKRLSNNDIASAPFHGNKSKFSGQFSNNNTMLNNLIQANSKKADAKLPFKIAQTTGTTSSTASNQGPALGVTYQNSPTYCNKSTVNKRQRHKSMGDLDGLVKSNLTMNGFHNNLRQTNSIKTHTGTSTSNSIFNNGAPTNIALSNSRRLKQSSNCSFWKISEATFTDSSSINFSDHPNTSFATQAASSSGFTVDHSDIVKESNLDSVKNTYFRSPKHNNTNNGIYYNYCNDNINKTNDLSKISKREHPDYHKENPESKNNSKDLGKRPVASNIGGNDLDLSKVNSSNKASSSSNTSKPKLKSSILSRKTMTNLKSSPNFDSWRTFSFAENYITNVFC